MAILDFLRGEKNSLYFVKLLLLLLLLFVVYLYGIEFWQIQKTYPFVPKFVRYIASGVRLLRAELCPPPLHMLKS